MKDVYGINTPEVQRFIFIMLAIALFATFIWFINDISIPKACKVPLAQMSQWCRDLVYS
jgi:hypothetical protein